MTREYAFTKSMSPDVQNKTRLLLQKVQSGAIKTGGTNNLWANRDVDLRISNMDSKPPLYKNSV